MDYRKLMNFFAKGNKWQFDLPKQKQKDFLSSISEPKDDIDRSFKQYQCQMLFVALSKRIVLNILSLFTIPLFLIVASCRRITTKPKRNIQAIIERNTHLGVIPKSLIEKYPVLDSTPWNKGWSLGLSDIRYVFKILFFIHRSPYFVLKNVLKGAIYSKMIKEYSPEVIVVFNEYSFTSSALTYLCELKRVLHIDVMHGEKLFYIRDSFFRFSQTYVWDEYYIKLFVAMRAPRKQFIAELPPFMSINPSDYTNSNYHSDYTYYLANYNENEIKNIVNSMAFAVSRGKVVRYRPHPRYSNLNLLRKYVDEKNIENPNSVDILTSVSNTTYAVGVYTTVLNQAYNAGKKVIIDDINFPEIYSKLKELDYNLFSMKIEQLSNFQL